MANDVLVLVQFEAQVPWSSINGSPELPGDEGKQAIINDMDFPESAVVGATVHVYSDLPTRYHVSGEMLRLDSWSAGRSAVILSVGE